MKLTALFKKNRKQDEPKVAIRQRDYLKLFQLMRDHRLLQLRVMGDSQPYQTMLLELNADEGYLLIDEPFPNDGLLSGRFEQGVVLEYESDGFCTRFKTVVIGRIDEAGDRYFQLAWPERVEEVQRRDQFRLEVTDFWRKDIRVSGIPDQQLAGVIDLSASGLRVAFHGNQVECIYAGSYLENLELVLRGCDPIRCHLDITHCHYVPDAELGCVSMTVAGGRLVGLSDRERETIQRFLHTAQRVQLREQAAEQVAEEIAA